MATKRKRRKGRRRSPERPPVRSAQKPPLPHPDDRPQAPWGEFPLTEIVIFVALVLLVVGFLIPPPQGFVMIAVGLVLGPPAGSELPLREHFASYRSHTLLLSAAVGVPVFGGLFVATKLSPAICAIAG